MKTELDDPIISLFKHYVNSGQHIYAKDMLSNLINEHSRDIDFLLTCLELWVALNEYPNALDVLQLLDQAGYPKKACELCLQLVNFRLKRLKTVKESLDCVQILLAAEKLTEAEAVLRHALELDPDSLEAKIELSKFYLDVSEFSLSVSMAKEVINKDESCSRAWTIYGNALRKMGKEEDAYKAHLKALSIDNESYDSLLDVVAMNVSGAQSNDDFEKCINGSNSCLDIYFKKYYKLPGLDVSLCKIKHDNEQAKYLFLNNGIESYRSFIEVTDRLLLQSANLRPGFELKISDAEQDVIYKYNKYSYKTNQMLDVGLCVNPDLDWSSIAGQYINSSPSMVVIDNFLNQDALEYLRLFCYEAKVWHKTYQHAYLGAFVDKGFVSKVHLQIADELKVYLSGIIKKDRLEQLWAFKYDSVLGKGINIHADFARINLNFWITPDEYHLNKQNGGLIVYTEPAPRDWNHFDYNINSDKIYEYLGRHNSNSVTVPYKANRAVLFDSTLFHETDEIKFEDSYLGRRVNMTYLFGIQLK